MTVIAIGIGCTSRATADDILAVIEDAVKKGGLTPNVLATIDRPALNHILRIAAEKADLELRLMDVEELRRVAMGCKTHSEKSTKTQYGVPSVAEAAALAVRPRAKTLWLASADVIPQPPSRPPNDNPFHRRGARSGGSYYGARAFILSRAPVCLYAGSLIPPDLLQNCPANARIVDTAPSEP